MIVVGIRRSAALYQRQYDLTFMSALLLRRQSSLKALAEAKKSNVTVTMTYLGLGHARSGSGALQDELRVLQQGNGGENLCVFKGLVKPGGKHRETKR